MDVDLRDADWVLAFATERFEQRVNRGRGHGRDGDEERELESGGPRHARKLAACDGRHGAGRSGEDGREDLAEPDPDRLRQTSIFQVWMRLPAALGPATSDLELSASTSHITIPPISSDQPMIKMFSRCLPITLVSRKEGTAVTTNATAVRPRG